MLVSYHNTTRHRNLEDLDLDLHRLENLKFGIKVKLFLYLT